MIPMSKLLPKIGPETPTGCWPWIGSIDRSNGYGLSGGKPHQAHRAVYEAMRGPIPAGLTIDHLCRVRHCVNPDHLEAVTQRVNNLRSQTPQWQAHRAGRCYRGHPAEFSYIRRSTGNVAYCRICKAEAQRRRYAARKAP